MTITYRIFYRHMTDAKKIWLGPSNPERLHDAYCAKKILGESYVVEGTVIGCATCLSKVCSWKGLFAKQKGPLRWTDYAVRLGAMM